MAAEMISGRFIEDDDVFESVPNWTVEDFLESSRPHAWVLERGGENEYKIMRYRDKVAEYAKTLKIRNFVSQFNNYRKAHKRDGIARESNATDYDGQPIELLIGDYIANDAVGVIGFNSYHDRIQVCAHPIMLTKRLINIDSDEVQVEIAFRRGELWRYLVVPKTTIATASQITSLSAHGVGVDSENAKALVRYFTEIEHLNYSTLAEVNSVGRMGWINNEMFSPYMNDLQFDGDISQKKSFDAVKPTGSFDRWIDTAGKAREHSTVIRIILAASFASALVKPCDCLPFILHIWGDTGFGKTVALKLAASVWASPTEEGGFLRSFNSTSVGLEMAAAFCNSLPLCIDELQVVRDRKSFDDIIYMLTEGIGRVRGAKAGGLQYTKTWRNAIITTGEVPISSDNSGGGAVNRIIEVNYTEKLFDDPREIISTITSNYGSAGKYFVEKLAEKLNLARDIQRDYFRTLCLTETTEKQALTASLILTADKLLSEWLFKGSRSLTVDDIAAYLSTKKEVDINTRALEWLYGWVAENLNCFHSNDDRYTGAVYGKIYNGYYYIIRKKLAESMQADGYNLKAFLAWAYRKGLLIASPNRYDKLVRIRGDEAPARCVIIKAPQMDTEELEPANVDELPL